jgi:hypothetical protein
MLAGLRQGLARHIQADPWLVKDLSARCARLDRYALHNENEDSCNEPQSGPTGPPRAAVRCPKRRTE